MARRKPSKPRRTPDGRKLTEALSDAQRAQVWAMREENLSTREIAVEIGCSSTTVQRVLQDDPARLEALVAANKEVRAKLWQQLENVSLKGALRWAALAEDLVFTKEGKLKKGITREMALNLAPRMLGALRLAGDSSTQRTLALGVRLPGGATVAAVVGGDHDPEAELDADGLIDKAISFGPDCVKLLPERLRVYAERRMEKTG